MLDSGLCSLTQKLGDERIDVQFETLGVQVSTSQAKLRVLEGVTGGFRAGNVSAIMGPSGAGKTTLLNVLSGRHSGFKVTGRVCVNGDASLSLKSLAPLVSFVPQEDVMSIELTVREILDFAAVERSVSLRRLLLRYRRLGCLPRPRRRGALQWSATCSGSSSSRRSDTRSSGTF